ncbi:hypothetical protein ACFL9U_12480 [Thermodesulfobacteriota bacterium]
MKKVITILTICITLGWSSLALAGDKMLHGDHQNTEMSGHGKMQHKMSAGTYEHQAVTDGVRAEFQIMSLSSMNMEDPDGATHHIMVKLFNASMNHPIKEAVGKVKIIDPDKGEQVNSLENYNGIFAANFSVKETGKYGVICLVKINGKSHLYKFWYTHG